MLWGSTADILVYCLGSWTQLLVGPELSQRERRVSASYGYMLRRVYGGIRLGMNYAPCYRRYPPHLGPL